MTTTGIVDSMKDFYWDIRPKPEFGTIELRICDSPLTVERAAALAVYLQALARYLLQEQPEMPEEDDYLVYTYNRFQACRFGLDGVIIHPKTREIVFLREDIVNTFKQIEPHAAALSSLSALEQLDQMVRFEDNDAVELRRVYKNTKSMQDMVHHAVGLFRGGR